LLIFQIVGYLLPYLESDQGKYQSRRHKDQQTQL
jgi:hypothetical protein